MAVLDVLNLNLGTEQNPNWVLHDLHDKRISTTAVTTATHLLATNAGVTAMNPITAANLASVLGKTLLTRRTRLTDFDLAVLKQAVADQNLEKYGLRVGDQKTINGHTYVIAGLNPMKGTSTPYRLTQNHVGLIVIPHVTQKWNESHTQVQMDEALGMPTATCIIILLTHCCHLSRATLVLPTSFRILNCYLMRSIRQERTKWVLPQDVRLVGDGLQTNIYLH